MTQKEKTELIKAICGYLPYGIVCDRPSGNSVITKIYFDKEYNDWVLYNEEGLGGSITLEKPYLRPMESMTEEEENEWWKFADKNTIVETHSYSIDWLNAHRFDYRGLIPKGLALPAPDGMYITYKYFPPEFKTYEKYAEYLKSKGLAFDAPDGK